ncbi:TPA: hypothetical protein IAC10_04315 [Candidatus Scatousia excrementigallinarum]|uniref:Uncharacterized protein n=1 Tax=Candidatus Scatousia excrementigallinarum TaxID=2840935 RepID=A0A9D1JMF2_9BACT|nr:hypothetical protein [Candidatus Scatousia excrementigallinarum]
MAQQFQNGGQHAGSVTISIRSTRRYAVVNEPGKGKHYHKPRKHHIPNEGKTRDLAKRNIASLQYTADIWESCYHATH